jgi:hypothetical protein
LTTHRADSVALLYEHLSRLTRQSFAELGHKDVAKGGVYFFFEAGETRFTPDGEPRIVRVGTHGLTATSKATLWQRLAAHRGNAKVSTGNHRGSIFRLLIGDALRRRDPSLSVDTWGVGSHAPHEVRRPEGPLEHIVSEYIATMPFVWLTIDDRKDRAFIERNAIALLSNYNRQHPVDPASSDWLGRHSSRDRVRESGLWNNDYVDAEYDASFTDLISQMRTR